MKGFCDKRLQHENLRKRNKNIPISISKAEKKSPTTDEGLEECNSHKKSFKAVFQASSMLFQGLTKKRRKSDKKKPRRVKHILQQSRSFFSKLSKKNQTWIDSIILC